MQQTVESLSTWLRRIERWTVLTGAGVSAASGIPTYRDRTGRWLRVDSIQHREFVESHSKRQRYWARSMVGWKGVNAAFPNANHYSLAALEHLAKIDTLITQNVDRLHQRAGSQKVIDLHGRLDRAICLTCGSFETRESLQQRLLAANPFVPEYSHIARPDGDADVPDDYISQTVTPDCLSCGGTLMPMWCFSVAQCQNRGLSNVSRPSIDRRVCLSLAVRYKCIQASDFAVCAKTRIPIVIVNEGQTRADDIATSRLVAWHAALVSAIDELSPSTEKKTA